MKKPAALTRRVASACSSASVARTDSTWAWSARSAVMPKAGPSFDSSVTVSSPRAWSRPTITALPPPATTSAAVALPMPLLPPTTINLRPSKLYVMSVSSRLHWGRTRTSGRGDEARRRATARGLVRIGWPPLTRAGDQFGCRTHCGGVVGACGDLQDADLQDEALV